MTPESLTECLAWINFPLLSLYRSTTLTGKITFLSDFVENVVNKDSHFNTDKTKTHLKKHLNSFSNKSQKNMNKIILWHYFVIKMISTGLNKNTYSLDCLDVDDRV